MFRIQTRSFSSTICRNKASSWVFFFLIKLLPLLSLHPQLVFSNFKTSPYLALKVYDYIFIGVNLCTFNRLQSFVISFIKMCFLLSCFCFWNSNHSFFLVLQKLSRKGKAVLLDFEIFLSFMCSSIFCFWLIQMNMTWSQQLMH